MGGRAAVVAGVITLLVALVAGAIVVGGEVSRLLLSGLQVAPFLVLAVLAQAGLKRTWARVLTYVWLALLVLVFAVLVLGLTVVTLQNLGAASEPAELAAAARRSALAILGSLGLAAVFLFRGVRGALARLLPIDPDALTHKVALFFLVFFVVLSHAQLAVLDGRPPLLVIAENASAEELLGGRSAAGQMLDMLYSLAWTLPLAVIAAGYPVYRSLRAAVHRLGFTRPTRRQVLIGLGLAGALVGVFTGVHAVISLIWGSLGWQTTNVDAFRKLLGAGLSPVGAVVIGVTAGVGEEVTTRGLLQPRLGKVLPNLAFVAAHAYQYGPDALVSVFLMGMVLAFVRAWSSTTIAALVHGTYDFVVIMLDVLGV